MVVAGIMTGTSVDAIDVAVCQITAVEEHHQIRLLRYTQAPYPPHVEELVQTALAGKATLAHLTRLPFDLAHAYADALQGALADVGVRPALIAVHGQTLWHEPPHGTWQAFSAPALAARTGYPVVADFRAADVALGGQGAPLVPMFDLAVFRSTQATVVLNIGGMANVTLLPEQAREENVRAFDTGPGNVLIDAICQKTFGKRFDANGSIAAAGRIIPRALEQLQQHPYFSFPPPKSTGREFFGAALAEELWKSYAHPSVPGEDLVTTVTELTAWSIADHIQRYQPDTRTVITSGGGVHNNYLMHRLGQRLPGINIISSEEAGVHPDAKEAMAFAYLGWRTWHGMHGNLPSVTGASRTVQLGSITKP